MSFAMFFVAEYINMITVLAVATKLFFFFQAEDGIRDLTVTGVQTCALPICSTRDTPTYRYVGAEARRRDGGWESLGDMGFLDHDGYLHLGDRAADMILSGGANIYPAEIEAALQEHPGIRSCAVIGLPDDDKGNVVHAILEADGTELDEVELRQFLAERLVVYKLPRSFEFVDQPLRDDAGKVRR